MEGETKTTVEPKEEKKDDKSTMFVNWDTNVKEPPIDKEVQDRLREIEASQVVKTDNITSDSNPVKDDSTAPSTPPAPQKQPPVSTGDKPTVEPAPGTAPSKDLSTEKIIPPVQTTPNTELQIPAGTPSTPDNTSDDDTLKVPDNYNNEDSWQKLSLEQGFKIENNDYDSYIKAYNEHLESVSQDAVSDIDKDIYKRISPAGQKMLDYELNGGNYFELQNTLKEYDKYLSLNDENLIREEHKSQLDTNGNRFYTDTRIEEILNELSEDENKIREKANEIRVSVNNARNEVESKAITMQKQIAETSEQESSENTKNDSAAIYDALASESEYMGKKIDDKARTYLQNQWDNGHVQQILQDPKTMVEFMIFSSFKDQIFKDNGRIAYEKGKESIKKDLYNIPPNLGGGKKVEFKGQSESPFDAWKDVPIEVNQQ